MIYARSLAATLCLAGALPLAGCSLQKFAADKTVEVVEAGEHPPAPIQ